VRISFIDKPMAGFSRVSGTDRGFERVTISSITVTPGDLLMWDYENEVAILATSAVTPERVAGVAVEAANTLATSVLIQKISEFDEYIVDTTNNTATTDNYHRFSLTDKDELANGADQTDDTGIFMQLSPIGGTTNKKVRGRFVTRQDRAA
jgi:hypothetical protein